ncbi:hypothetical protein F5B22DRAFT_48034 [Xylaria bambusicola]|uniref:uncharacterized protein n=1 Tax=Xylaria bambusicola TaxID=326684 RepID=UPI0020073456|nr:uncharacterized protein F5B22DRAFT_48034 [Xylaria bambusicola]KAI0520701.1 hypothetical protein F5B22DRAFT_48034 [Xylaria bambusicola]
MIFDTILPAVTAIVMSSFTRFSGAGLAVMPCSTATDTPSFMISDFTGGISKYTGGESFAFYLNTTYNDYHSGCSGSIHNGADDNGMQFCSTRIPGWNVSYIMTHDHKVLINHAFLCSQADGAIVSAHAEGATQLNITSAPNGRLSMRSKSHTFAAAVTIN